MTGRDGRQAGLRFCGRAGSLPSGCLWCFGQVTVPYNFPSNTHIPREMGLAASISQMGKLRPRDTT